MMNECIVNEVARGSNRIVITKGSPFNPKRKKENSVLGDIRDIKKVEEFWASIKLDQTTKINPGWMTMPEVYVTFLDNKSALFSFGILIDSWVRSSVWDGDYKVLNYHWMHEWLLENGVSYFERDT